jgi:hypothetical protein
MDHAVMPVRVLGERERLPHHPPDPLAQGVVPTLHVRGLPGLLACNDLIKPDTSRDRFTMS